MIQVIKNSRYSKRIEIAGRSIVRAYRTFEPGDIVIARHVMRPDRPSLSSPLSKEKEWNVHTAVIPHAEVLGRPSRSSIVSAKGQKNQKFILTHPTLEEYATHRKRLAQPIYPLDAASIVALADIHEDETGGMGYGRVTGTAKDLVYPDFPVRLPQNGVQATEGEEKMNEFQDVASESQEKASENLENVTEHTEIKQNDTQETKETEEYPFANPFLKMRQYLEAGTGHGSLTLAICRQIHAANYEYRRSGNKFDRGAVLHSIDRNANHSKNGRYNVRDFRRGMYVGDVEFHIAESPEKWLEEKGDVWKRVAMGENVDPEELEDAHEKPLNQETENLETLSEPDVEQIPSQDSTPQYETPGSFLSAAFLDLPSPESTLSAIAHRLIVDAPLIIFCPSVSQIQDLVEAVRLDETIDLTLTNTVELLPGIAGGSMRSWDVRSTVVRETGDIAKVCRPRVGTGITGGGFVAVFRKLPYRARVIMREEKEQAAAQK